MSASEFFKSKTVRTVFWVQFLIILALGLHFFTPDLPSRRFDPLDGRVMATGERITLSGGSPEVSGGGAGGPGALRKVRVMPVELLPVMHDARLKRRYCLALAVTPEGSPLVLGNYPNAAMGKPDGGVTRVALMRAYEAREWLDVFILGENLYGDSVYPNILAVFATNGTLIVGAQMLDSESF